MSFRESSDSCMAPGGGRCLGGSFSASPRLSARRRRLVIEAGMSGIATGASGAGTGLCGSVGAKGA